MGCGEALFRTSAHLTRRESAVTSSSRFGNSALELRRSQSALAFLLNKPQRFASKTRGLCIKRTKSGALDDRHNRGDMERAGFMPMGICR